jgi:ribonuclease VapC
MVIDSSALQAILQREPEARFFNEAIEADPARLLSAGNFVEVSIVAEVPAGAEGLRELDHFLETADIEVVDVDRHQATAARRAFALYGKGRHRPGLNFGDCFAYALAKVTGQPLLYKGDDFSKTDLSKAV